MEFTKENTLKLMEEINDHMIDIRNTIENADELNGEDSIYIFDDKNRMHSYREFAEKRKYKFNFLPTGFLRFYITITYQTMEYSLHLPMERQSFMIRTLQAITL